MATAWMSELLSAGSLIKCFHGSKGLQPQLDPNLDALTALSLLKKWSVLNRAKFVGLNHLASRHGVSGLGASNSVGAPFCALVRNPILATDSQYQERAKAGTPFFNEPLINQQLQSMPMIREIIDPTDTSNFIFFRCALSVIIHLAEVEIHGCQTFKFENYTTDYSQIKELIRFISNGAMTDDLNIAAAFETLGKKNTHRKKNIGFDNTWENSWTDTQRQIYFRLQKHLLAECPPRFQHYPDAESLIQASE